MKISHSGEGSARAALTHRVDRAVREVGEVVALPVVARARRQQRIERRLPADERVRRDDVGDRLAERAQRARRLLALRHVARVAGGEDEDLLAVPFGGQERQRRRLAHHRPGRQLVRRLVGETAELGQERLRLVERMHDEPGQDLRPERVQPELERGDDAEIAAAAAQRPEEIRVLASRSPARARRRP